jgi:uncharacterized protein (TIGR02145 family)
MNYLKFILVTIFAFLISGCKKNEQHNSNSIIDSVVIGSQTWMLKNLDVATYRNGDPIPQVSDSVQWGRIKTGAWCYYKNSLSTGKVYGKLYNWYAVHDPRGLAPIGWHVASEEEWNILADYLGGAHIAGTKLKDANAAYWESFPTSVVDNSSGFSALPGGGRSGTGLFYGINKQGNWWTSSEYDTIGAVSRFLFYTISDLSGVVNDFKKGGYSVRCVKD